MESAPEECILCGSSTRELLIEKDSWQVCRCTNCGLGFLDPRPSEDEIKILYGKEYFSRSYDKGFDPDSVEFKKRLSQETHRIRFFRGFKKRGRILDIGCGNGYFLAACRAEGYDVQGLDISDWASEFAVERLGIPVITGEIDSVGIPSNSYDIISMWHFLEHTRNPRMTISKVLSWLKSDGILIIDVPNYESTDARLNREEWVGWQLPYHLYHFTPESLEMLLDIFELRIEKRKTYHSEAIKNRLREIYVPKPLARLLARMYSGTSLAVVSKRK